MSTDSRGQTTLDFTIGISFFLLVLIFVFIFIPGLLSPFDQSNQENTVATNRIADQLSTGMLADSSAPYALDTYCTVQFFNENAPSKCTYVGGTLEEQFSVDVTSQNVNVTIRGNANTAAGEESLCWDNSTSRLVDVGNSDCNVPLQRGNNPPPDNDASVTAQRAVLLNGQDVTLYVVVW